MKRIGTQPALLALFIASTLNGHASEADSLHRYGNDGAWCHVESGWMFPAEVGAFARVLQPYNIDGNDDAGAEYKHTWESSRGTVEVDVYAADSAATDASIDGAKATAARNAGEGAKVVTEKPFQIAAAESLQGVKIEFAVDPQPSDESIHLYYFTTDRWHVKVLARGKLAGVENDQAIDAFVQALPWSALGTNPGIH